MTLRTHHRPTTPRRTWTQLVRHHVLVAGAAAAVVALYWSTAFALPFLHVSGDSDGDHVVDGSDGAPGVYCGTSHADVNGNGIPNAVEVGLVRNAFQQEPAADPKADQNHNDAVDYVDELLIHAYYGQSTGSQCSDPSPDPTPASGLGTTAGPDIVLSAPALLDGSEGSVSPLIFSSGSTTGQRGHYLRLHFDETVVQAVSVTNDNPEMHECLTTIDNANNAPGPDGSVILRCRTFDVPPAHATHVGNLATYNFSVSSAGDPAFCIARFVDADALRGTFTVGTDIAPQSEASGSACGAAPMPLDTDVDGCSNVEEWGSSPMLGGQRDPQNEFDFYDVNATQKIDTIDIGLVRSKFNQNYPPYDRSAGAQPWAPGPPDGTVNGIDVGLVRASFNHSCQAAP